MRFIQRHMWWVLLGIVLLFGVFIYSAYLYYSHCPTCTWKSCYSQDGEYTKGEPSYYREGKGQGLCPPEIDDPLHPGKKLKIVNNSCGDPHCKK